MSFSTCQLNFHNWPYNSTSTCDLWPGSSTCVIKITRFSECSFSTAIPSDGILCNRLPRHIGMWPTFSFITPLIYDTPRHIWHTLSYMLYNIPNKSDIQICSPIIITIPNQICPVYHITRARFRSCEAPSNCDSTSGPNHPIPKLAYINNLNKFLLNAFGANVILQPFEFVFIILGGPLSPGAPKHCFFCFYVSPPLHITHYN